MLVVVALTLVLLVVVRGGRWTSLDASFARCFAIF